MRLHLPALAAASLALTAAAPAAAAAPATIYGGTLPDDAPFALRFAKDGRTLKSLLAHVRTTCDDGQRRTLSGQDAFASGPAIEKGDAVFPRTRLSARGTLRADGTGTADFEDGTGAVTERLRGSVRNGRGRGTLSVTIVVTDNATGAKRTCRSGKLRWTAVSSPGAIFAGTTSDGRPIVLQRSRDGRQVDALWVSFYAACQEAGGGFAIGEELLDFPLRSGVFGDQWTYEPDKTISALYSLRGRVGTARASGTLRVLVTVKGDEADSGDTTQLSWSARSSKGAKVKRAKDEIRVGGAAARGHMGTS
jgi:hypothetical protein